MLHTHSFTYHGRYNFFLSQHFSFPCQYHSTNAPYSFIHLPPTLCNVFLPVLQFLLSFIPPMLHTHAFIYTSLLPEGQTGEAWEPSKSKAIL